MTKLTRTSMLPDVPSFFTEFFRDDDFWPNFMGSRWISEIPAANIIEHEDAFSLELAIPGMSKKDFNIEIDNDNLVVSSEKKMEMDEAKENYTRKEFSYSTFSRSFRLPELVDADKIKAIYKDGILRLNIPKMEEARKHKVKEISVS